MICYRLGDTEQGYIHYERAAAVLDNAQTQNSRALAMAYWAQEAKLANDPKADFVITKARDIVEKSSSLAAKSVLGDIVGNLAASESRQPELFQSAISWKHDTKRNLLILDKKPAFGNRTK